MGLRSGRGAYGLDMGGKQITEVGVLDLERLPQIMRAYETDY
jgi:hypothetical protein